MKKVIFFLALLLTCSLLGYAQKGISYQAVILDPKPIEIPGQEITGQPFVNGDVSLKFKIFSSTFVQEFEEVHAAKTDAYGLVNVLIGSISPAAFSSLVWDSNPKNLQVWVSFDQGGTYTKVSEQVLTYNPYAIYAETAGKLGGTLGIAAGGTGATTVAGARANLGLGNVDNTADAAKPISTATQAALDTKANASEVTTSLATKANASEVNASLATKANAEEVATAVATKANAAEVSTALATKANASDVSASLALKEDVSNKANTPLGSSTTLYPTQSAVKTYVDAQVAGATLADANGSTKGKIQLAGDLAGTAAAPTVPGLALKANASDVTTALAVKADTAYVLTKVAAATIGDANGSTKGKIQLAGDLAGTAAAPTVPGLALKANTAEVNTSLALKAPIASPTFTGTVSGITKSMVGLGSVDNTTDAAKPISTATQAALDQKANAADLTSLTTTVNTNTASITATAADLATLTTTVNANTASITANTGDILLKANTTDVTTALALKAPLASPALSGVPTAPTAAANTNTTQLATTAFVASAVNTLSGNSVPYTGATRAVNLGNYDLSVNGLTIGKGGGAASLNTAIGGYSLNSNSTGNSNTAIGYLSLYKNSLGANNTASGVGALQRNTIGSNNTANGVNSLTANSEGENNTSIGSYSLERNSTGSNNIAIGYNSLNYNTTAGSNTAIGNQSLSNNSTGEQNTANGYKSLRLNTGSYNTANGTYSLESNTTGAYNTALGYSAGSVLANGNASNSTSDYSVYLGSNTKASADDAQNEIVIGYNAIGGGSNTVKLGNTSVTKVITSGAITAGAVTYPNTNGTAGQVLIANANGNASWGSASGAGVPYIGATGAVNLGAYDLKVNGLTIGKGNGSTLSNTAIGLGALTSNTQGSDNTSNGYNSLNKNTVGFANSAFGSVSLFNNLEGGYNSSFGSSSLYYNTSGSYNSSFGSQALYKNTTGSENTATGFNALTNNTVGSYNSAIGVYALANNTLGQENTANGVGSLYGNTEGNKNTAIGRGSLSTNTLGNSNTAIGFNADVETNSLENATAVGNGAKVAESNTIQLGNSAVTNVNTSGAVTVDGIRISKGGYVNSNQQYVGKDDWSTAVGFEALINNNGGGTNTAFGYTALKNNVIGGDNSAFGPEALRDNTDGARNTAIGRGTLIQNLTGNENTAVGNEALNNQTSGDGNTAIGGQSGESSENSTYGTFLGYRTRQEYGKTLTNATAIGYNAEVTTSNTIQLGNSDVTNVNTSRAITVDGIRISQGGSVDSNQQSVGRDGGSTAVGYEALISNNGGGTNTAFGYTALKNNVIGGDNSAFGPEALRDNTDGARNTAIGRGTLIQNLTGNENTAVGNEALNNQTSGDGNTAIGYRAGEGSENSSGGTFLGYRARQQGGQTLTNATAIGYNAEVTAPNTIQLGNSDVTNVNTSGAITVDGIRISRGGNVDSNQQSVGRDGWSTAVGFEALISNNGGYNNTAIGYAALKYNVTGYANAAFGDEALRANSGNGNTAIGHATLVLNTSGAYNTAVGTDAAYNSTGMGNTAIGANTLVSLASGDYNTALGNAANVSNGLSNATAIGYQALVTETNTIQLGNADVAKVNTSGTVWSAGFHTTSDLRLKTNIQPIPNTLDLIMKLNPVQYNKKNSIESSDYTKTENGFIAQELQKVLPYLVSEGTDQDKILSVDYNSIIPVLTKGIQEQQVLIEAQQKQIDELKMILEKLLNEKK